MALMADSDFNKSRYGLGAVCERREDFDCAKKQYELAMQDKNIRLAARATNNLARLYVFQERDYQTAIVLASVALKQAESPAIEAKVKSDLYKNLGWAHFVDNSYGEAEENLREAIAVEEDNTPAHCLLAQVLEAREKETEALGQWQKCLDYSTPPQNPEVNTWKNMAKQRLKGKRQE
jgi:Flp pilus assembly protein TadD